MRAMLIYNPSAGPHRAEDELREAARELEAYGWQVTWRVTHGRFDAMLFAREAALQGYDVAIAAGGDGTIGQVVNGIAGTDTALGVLPVGTTNVWAREIGLPLITPLHPNAVQEAARMMAEGEWRTVDVGRMNDRYFLMWVGVGMDAEVTARVESWPEQKRRLGMLAFAIAAVAQTLSLTGTKMYIEMDGRKLERRALLLVASNIQLYAGFLRIAPMASLTDGLLDVCIFQGYTGLSAYTHFFSILLGLHTRNPEVTYHQVRHLVVRPAKPLSIQADGDVAGYAPVEITVIPQYVRVIVPKHTLSPALHPAGSASAPVHFWEHLRR
ncbi:MAG: diacylglycerol/lipid kinase family protein [Anaerolineae bacterium]